MKFENLQIRGFWVGGFLRRRSQELRAAGRLTWMRHLLTSLAHRALLQPEVRDSPERRKRSAAAAAAAAGRIV